MTLFLNGDIGIGDGYGGREMPFFKSYYAGGPGSVRGYQPYSLGPQDGSGAALGGTRKLVGNAEVQALARQRKAGIGDNAGTAGQVRHELRASGERIGGDFEIEKPRAGDRRRRREIGGAPIRCNGLRNLLRLLAGGFGDRERAIGLKLAEIGAVGTAHVGVLGIEPELSEHICVRRGECAGEVFHGGIRQ